MKWYHWMGASVGLSLVLLAIFSCARPRAEEEIPSLEIIGASYGKHYVIDKVAYMECGYTIQNNTEEALVFTLLAFSPENESLFQENEIMAIDREAKQYEYTIAPQEEKTVLVMFAGIAGATNVKLNRLAPETTIIILDKTIAEVEEMLDFFYGTVGYDVLDKNIFRYIDGGKMILYQNVGSKDYKSDNDYPFVYLIQDNRYILFNYRMNIETEYPSSESIPAEYLEIFQSILNAD